MAHVTGAVIDDFTDWPSLVRAAYHEMPGLNPTLEQAQRLWNLEPATLREVFATLVASHFLRRTSSGTYVLDDLR
jgi:DNA-binding IclR family transcriptional regulator